jgi:hypothetical protein
MRALNMNESQVREKLKEVEASLGGKLSDVYELKLVSGGQVYIYGCAELLERNAMYEVQVYESDYFLIGQDGDLGYFLSLKGGNEVYSLDLGALGSLAMNKEADSIYGL